MVITSWMEIFLPENVKNDDFSPPRTKTKPPRLT